MTEVPLEIESKELSDEQIVSIIEAILLVSDTPLEATSLAATLGLLTDDVAKALMSIQKIFAERNSGIELRYVAGGWRLYTRADVAEWVEKYVRDGQVARLTQASLETLAVIAYKQPISRARISAIRGVNVDGVVKTLENRGLIAIASTDHETGALLYHTTDMFLEKLGLGSLTDLPEIAEFIPDLPTAIELEESL
ncbi:MAG: Segregation and condensation protein [Actinomycetota bacterium]